MRYELIIRGGTIVDGSGGAPYRGDVAITAGKIAAVGAIEGRASEEIDASGCIVTPGFVDLHTHYDGQVSWDPELAPSCYHGVTTAVMGSCGVGFAPCRVADRDRLIDLMQGVEDIPGSALSEGIRWRWETVPEYIAALEAMPRTLDVAVQVPHDALRVFVMGDRAVANEVASDEDIAAMRGIVREALEAGAVGFTTGRTDNHRNVDGAPTPASEATARELAGIAGAFEGLDFGILHAVSDFDMATSADRFDPEFDVIEAMAAAAPTHGTSVSLMQRTRDTSQWKKILARVDRARAAGLDMRVQVAPRGIGVILGLEATFHPFVGFPSYKRVGHLPLAERVAILRDPAVRAAMLSERSEPIAGDGSAIPPLADELLANLDFVAMRLYRLTPGFDYEPAPDTSLLAEAFATGRSTLEVLYDALLEDGGERLLYFPIFNYIDQNLDTVHAMLTHPAALPGLSDGGAHVGTICDASFPTFLLSHWTRDRTRDAIPLERAVQMLTRDGAVFASLHDRGELRPGLRADVNVIDHAALTLELPKLAHDLPAGGRRFVQRARGYRATIVAGEITLRDDALTGARPGRIARPSRPAA